MRELQRADDRGHSLDTLEDLNSPLGRHLGADQNIQREAQALLQPRQPADQLPELAHEALARRPVRELERLLAGQRALAFS